MKGKKRKNKNSIIFILISILLIENLAPVSNLVYANGTYNKLVSNLLSTAENKDNMSVLEVEDELGDTTTSEPENQKDMDEAVSDNKPVDETIDEESPPKEDDTNEGNKNESEEESIPSETENQEDTNEALPIGVEDVADGNTATNPIRTSGIDYIVKYHHADGTVKTVSDNLTSGSQTFDALDEEIIKTGEEYSGTTVSAGHSVVDLVETTDEATGDITTATATITHNTQEHLVKINFYYKKEYSKIGDDVATEDVTYNENGQKIYDTSREGLHTDKTAEVSGTDGRTFDITLESWNVKNKVSIADIGMVLDASGSMVWTSQIPDKINVGTQTYGTYKILTQNQVDEILDKRMTDNSKLSYNGYKYYVYEKREKIKEYVPLGYSDGSLGVEERYVGDNPGWYYVNSGGKTNYVGTLGTAKQYIGISENTKGEDSNNSNKTINFNSSNSLKDWGLEYNNSNKPDYFPTLFYVDNEGYLKCFFYCGSGEKAESSYVYEKSYTEENNYTFNTKAETLQHSIAKFISKLNPLTPSSKVGMTRFSRSEFDFKELLLLNWTNDTKTSIAAMNLAYGVGDNVGTSTGTTNNQYNYGHTGGTYAGKGFDSFNKILDGKSGLTNQKKYLILFTDGKDDNEASAKEQVDILKDKGYIIFTVMMQSAGTINSGAKELLQNYIASPRLDESGKEIGKYYWESDPNNYNSLIDAFMEIAGEIGENLFGYTVQDYIDPRFDLIDSSGNVLTVATNINKPITLSDGKKVTLKYDTTKKMYYLQWTNQEIPTTGLNSEKLDVWSSTITLRAKEDFIGGNNILTNGNEVNMNYVFDPSHPGSSGTDNQNGTYPSKGFPKTTVNPKIDLNIDDSEDTIFLGEKINQVYWETTDVNYYIEYLDRIGHLSGYDTEDLKEQLYSGIAVEDIPYYYLPAYAYDEDGNIINQTNQTGTENHENDQIGTLTYEWIACDENGTKLTDDKWYNEFTTTDTNDVYYKLKITYTPKTIADRNADNTTLNQDSGITTIKAPVGTERNTITEEGNAVVHIVDGQLVIQKKVKYDDLVRYLEVKDEYNEVFNFELYRSLNDAQPNKYRDVSITLSYDDEDLDDLQREGDYIILTSAPIINLPIGTYTIKEIDDNEYYSFNNIVAEVLTNTTTGNQSVFNKHQGKEATFACATAISQDNKGAIFYIGQVVNVNNNNIPPSPGTIVESKPYLNAQLGKAIITNEAKLGSITIIKENENGDKLEGAKFKLEEAIVTTDEEGNEIWEAKKDENNQNICVGELPTNENGVVEFEELPIGNYILTEVKTTQGHNLLAKPVNITIPFEYEDGIAFDLTYTISNKAIFNLPTSGGSGIASHYLIAGAVLIGLSVSLLSIYIYRKNKVKG